MVELGALFPQTEIGADPGAIRAFALAAEDLGYTHLLAYEHVIGAQIDRPDRQGRRWPYTHRSVFHEPMVLYGYLAAVTRRIGLVTAILIAPQRQTVLIAKQAAAIDVLSEGRLRLGLGLGWNAVEYEALNENFHDRGKRIEEQVQVLRALWTEPVVSFHGRWHHIDEAGINPLPVQRPIPIWMGGWVDPVLKRIARIADGWIVSGRPEPNIVESAVRLKDYVQEEGRDPASVGLQGAVLVRTGGPEQWRQDYETWRSLGATHVAVNTMGADFTTADQHIEALRQAKEALS